MCRILCIVLVLVVTGMPARLFASSSLLFFEAQAVGGWSSMEKDFIPYSMNREEVMQKPGIGLDYVQKISTERGDIATIALQARLAYDDTYEYYMEPQLYNAYIKGKLPFVDLWLGHSRPALGLSTILDSHGLLLHTLAMRGFGYDRDWGGGLIGEYDRGDVQLSVTTGSGMPVYFRGNYLASGRISYGILSQDNFTIGLSGAYGRVLETMGYHLMMDDPVEMGIGGIDITWLLDNFEIRLEAMGGTKMEETVYAVFGRFGVNILDENRLRLEFQPVYTGRGHDEGYELSGGLSFQATGDLALRGLYTYDSLMEEHRVVAQAYVYLKVL